MADDIRLRQQGAPVIIHHHTGDYSGRVLEVREHDVLCLAWVPAELSRPGYWGWCCMKPKDLEYGPEAVAAFIATLMCNSTPEVALR